jgi:hypothetical protein
VGELTHSRWHYNLYGINIHLMIRWIGLHYLAWSRYRAVHTLLTEQCIWSAWIVYTFLSAPSRRHY